MKKEIILFYFFITILSSCQTSAISESEVILKPYLGLWAGYNKAGSFVQLKIDDANIYSRVFNTDKKTLNNWQKYSYIEINGQFKEILIEYFDFGTNEWKKQEPVEIIVSKYIVIQGMLVLELIKNNNQISEDLRYHIILQRPNSPIFTDPKLEELVEIENNFEKVSVTEIPFDSSSWKDDSSLKKLQYISPSISGPKLSKSEYLFQILLGNIKLVTDRQRMLNNLLDIIEMKSKQELINMLGDSLVTNYWKEENSDLIYVLGSEPGFAGIDSQWLLIWFKDNQFLKFEIKTD